ncbi:MAG TPA: hypothetical protein P5277_02230 [Candidatus Paceibacterota bacterium]|nr:hypothetical protein [Candidatus Paceibacterota bacterium]
MLKESKKRVYSFVGIFLVLNIFCCFSVYSEQYTKTLILETNVIAGESESSGISIEIPDYLFLGNVSVGELSENVTSILIKNTGDVKPVKVIAELVNSNDYIYKYLRISNSSKTSGFKTIGEFVISLNTQKTVYTRIDLREFEDDLENNILNHRAEIRFIAMEA